MHLTYYRSCWHVISRCFFTGYTQIKGVLSPISWSPAKELYDPKAFITHAASLRQAFAHCERFSTAASRRSLGSVSVPVLAVNLSVRLDVLALVCFYHTNKLISHGLFFNRKVLRSPTLMIASYLAPPHPVLAVVSNRYSRVKGRLPMYY